MENKLLLNKAEFIDFIRTTDKTVFAQIKMDDMGSVAHFPIDKKSAPTFVNGSRFEDVVFKIDITGGCAFIDEIKMPDLV